MLNRWLGIALFALMASANAWLFVRDVLPRWWVGDPPDPITSLIPSGGEDWIQMAIYDAQDKLVGRSWTHISRQSAVAIHESLTFIYPIRLPARPNMETPALKVEITLTFQENSDNVDELRMVVAGLPLAVGLRGERVSSQFPCIWQVGEQKGSFILDADATRSLGDALRPFERLTGLEVGQSWRMQILNPMSRLVPGMNSDALEFDTILVRVTREEEIMIRGKIVKALRVEAPQTVGWVGPGGRVLRQEVDLPLIGKLRIEDEPYRESTLKKTVFQFRELIADSEAEEAQKRIEKEFDEF
ncbi:MAG: hypothetical protein AB7N71_02920 [Phycisphaerae bacterium]